ncbi:hypothetical protein D9758_011703 [Tetrapyrgos nigripes]|uniref:C2H2-type domain-containing protein n=1 Tax=Tetrapyrgos nigripes TaxID=182062 RepID=A0A8H5GD02_9AGAR|nr:hypothetical protein D9758_011703 [Tetrapyrgos nigripes]
MVRCRFPGCIERFKRQRDLTLHMNLRHFRGLADTSSQGPSLSSQSTAQQGTMEPTPDNFDIDPEDFDMCHPAPASPTHNGEDEPHASPSLPPSPHHSGAKIYHPHLFGQKLDEKGQPLVPDTPAPPIHPTQDPDNLWAPFDGEAEFRLADLLYRKVEMSQGNVDELMDIWSLFGSQCHPEDDDAASAPFHDYKDLFEDIDRIQAGDAPWKCFQTVVDESLGSSAPEWQKTSYQVWYRDPDVVISQILSNPLLIHNFDPCPYIHLDPHGKRRWSDFMSGNFAWQHASKIYDTSTDKAKLHGAMAVYVILGADKTTVSVATGHVEYHPLYISIGNITNRARRAHRNSVIPIGFLAIPKSDRKYDNDPSFRIFKKQLYHSSIAAILRSLRPAMTEPVLRQCPDGYFRRVIFELAAFIADYPEQVLLSGIVQGWCGRCTAPSDNLDAPADRRTRHLDNIWLEEHKDNGRTLWDNFGMDDGILPFTHHFPRADIHEMLSADILHQIIKGCFKDMLVEWILQYLVIEHGEKKANEIIDDIDRRLAVVPAFPGLRRFPHGRRFKQWTGDDSKALMKVFLPAVADYIPDDMMKCLSSFLDFCYLVRRSDIDEDMLQQINRSIQTFHHYRAIFLSTGVRTNFNLPRLHAMIHYPLLIIQFGAPNGLCASITESRHITAVKKPWRRSRRYNALSQMLLTNQRLDKLHALRFLLAHCGLLPPIDPPPDPFDAEHDDIGPVDSELAQAKVELAKTRDSTYPRQLQALALHIQEPTLVLLTQQFLHEQLHPGDDNGDIALPNITSKVNVYHSAVAKFYAPSDLSGVRGMMRERIRSTPSWYGHPRRDCVLVVINANREGFRGMSVARVRLFFSFRYHGVMYPCALVHWFNCYGHSRDPKTGMWVVRPGFRDPQRRQHPQLAVIHIDTLLRGVHLIPKYDSKAIPSEVKHYHSLDLFTAFYVNQYADYHANEIIF